MFGINVEDAEFAIQMSSLTTQKSDVFWWYGNWSDLALEGSFEGHVIKLIGELLLMAHYNTKFSKTRLVLFDGRVIKLEGSFEGHVIKLIGELLLMAHYNNTKFSKTRLVLFEGRVIKLEGSFEGHVIKLIGELSLMAHYNNTNVRKESKLEFGRSPNRSPNLSLAVPES
jgi:hypothetical protein